MDNKTARIALRKSIKHWCIDIRQPLLDGDSFSRGSFDKDGFDLRWVQANERVKCGGNYCELCKMDDGSCAYCPLCSIGEKCSYGCSAYGKFIAEPCKYTVQVMILTLIRCYRRANNGS